MLIGYDKVLHKSHTHKIHPSDCQYHQLDSFASDVGDAFSMSAISKLFELMEA